MSEQHSGQGGFSTRAIHAGQEPDAGTGAVITPIFQVSTYKQDGIGGFRGGYEYSRSANPTRTALEECIAALEGGSRGFAFASGLAGQDCVVRSLLVPGDHVVVPSDAYGGTYRYFNKVARPGGIDHSIAKIGDVDGTTPLASQLCLTGVAGGESGTCSSAIFVHQECGARGDDGHYIRRVESSTYRAHLFAYACFGHTALRGRYKRSLE